jgi:hypothetical protein
MCKDLLDAHLPTEIIDVHVTGTGSLHGVTEVTRRC